jgi:predicted permease
VRRSSSESPRRFWFLRRRPDEIGAELDEEFDAHLAMQIDALTEQGWTADDARKEAQRRFGDRERATHYCRNEDLMKDTTTQRRLGLIDLLQDTRICVRGLVRSPVLSLTILLTVGMGIGATTAMSAVIDAVFLRPLPYASADRIFRIYTTTVGNQYGLSVVDYLAIERQQTVFDAVAGFANRTVTFSSGGSGHAVEARLVSWRYFDVLGLQTEIGRGFTEADGREDTAPSVVVSHAFWTDHLGSRTDMVGQPLRFDGVDYLLAGVLSPTVGPLERGRQVFISARWTEPRRRGPFFITALGRLRAGVDEGAALSELGLISKQLFPVWRSSYQDERATWTLMDLKTLVLGDVDIKAMTGMAAAAVFVLWLIACANASSLLLARVMSRRRELAVRAALGASGGRIIRLLLAEGVLLAIGSAIIGLVVAAAGTRLVSVGGVGYVPRAEAIALDAHALAVLAVVTVISAALFALIPALHGVGGPMAQSMGLANRSATESKKARHLRRLLVAMQFAITTPLLIAATLLVVSLYRLQQVDLGFDARRVVTGAIQLPGGQYQGADRLDVWWHTLEERLRVMPGVTGVSLADSRPPSDASNFNNFQLEDSPEARGESQPVTAWIGVTPGHFAALGQSVLAGQVFDARATDDPVVVVDRTWANRFFPGERAVGKRLKSGGCTACPWTTVIGVVSDVKYAGLSQAEGGTAYWPIRGQHSRYVIVRASGTAAALGPEMRKVIAELDPSAALSSVATIDELVSTSLEVPRSLSLLIGVLAVIALVLSMTGIYGVMAHHVQQHSRDMGIRVALGGTRTAVGRLTLTQGLNVVAVGVASGVAIALLLTRLMTTLLFGTNPLDPWVFAGVASLMGAIALLACAIPTIRVLRLNPADVLRAE